MSTGPLRRVWIEERRPFRGPRKVPARRRAGRAARVGLSALLLCGTLLSGCAVGPDYQRPAFDLPDQFGDGPQAPTADGALAEWWTTLHDPHLSRLIEQALRDNLDLKRLDARVREARAARGIVAADLGPTIDLRGSYARRRSSGNQTPLPAAGRQAGAPSLTLTPGQPGAGGVLGPPSLTLNPGRSSTVAGGRPVPEQNLYELGFDASWELDVWGGIRRAVEAAEAEISAAREARRDIQVTLAAEVGRNYVELRGFQKRLAIARRNIATQRQTYELARSRFEAGLVGELDVAQAELQLASSEATLPTIEAGLAQAAHRLGVLLGRSPRDLRVELGEPAPIPAGRTIVPTGLPAELLRRRPDIRQAERELAAATARIGEATADLFPRFSLTGSFGMASADVQNLLDWRSRAFAIGPSVRWPVFDMWRIRANIDVRNAQQEQALQAYFAAILLALEDVENALVAYATEQVRRDALERAVTANRRAVELAGDLYSKGLSDFLNLLDTERTLFASEDQLVQSERGVTTNLIALYKALGGGWPAEQAGDASAAAPGAEELAAGDAAGR